jgi:S-adenosylmethionine hydrolase
VLFVGGIHIRDTYPTFGAAPEGALFFYAGSSGFVEAGANKVNAAAVLGVGPGAIVEISLVR